MAGFRRSAASLALVAVTAAACSTVLGLEDHEPFPADASVAADASPDVTQDVSVDTATDTAADISVDVASDAMDAASEDAPPPPPRVTKDIQVLYTFEEGSGNKVKDVSGVGAALDLTIESTGLVEWFPGYLQTKGSTLIASAGPATKIHDSCVASKEITVEAWVAPSTTGQVGPARIVTVSPDTSSRNFTLAQDNDQYFMRLRTTNTDSNGEPPVLTLPGTLTTSLTHVLYTRAADDTATIYLDGVIKGSGNIGGNFSPWEATNRFAVANEITKNRVWLGELHLVAVYSRALTATEAAQNFAAGAD